MISSGTERKAAIKVQGVEQPVQIPITSLKKTSINNQIMKKWQSIINLIADCIEVPAALIMKIHTDHISVFLSSATRGNPYAQGASDTLLHGLYCETVLGTNKLLLVPNATTDRNWDKNPDIKLGMISYLGLPIKWPDGEFFGTICVLDSKENNYQSRFIQLLDTIKESIEKDLYNIFINHKELQLAYKQLEKKVQELEDSQNNLQNSLETKAALLQEIHHRVKNNLQFISSLLEMQLDRFDEGTTYNELITIHNRILSMKIVHNMLYKSQDFTKIKLCDYTATFVKNLQNSFLDNSEAVQVTQNISCDITTNLDTAIYIGLIMNELLTNAFKYAFPNNKKGTIEISITPHDNRGLRLKISDNGIGIPQAISTQNTPGLGLKIVQSLVLQLNGRVKTIRNGKTIFEITIPKLEK